MDDWSVLRLSNTADECDSLERQIPKKTWNQKSKLVLSTLVTKLLSNIASHLRQICLQNLVAINSESCQTSQASRRAFIWILLVSGFPKTLRQVWILLVSGFPKLFFEILAIIPPSSKFRDVKKAFKLNVAWNRANISYNLEWQKKKQASRIIVKYHIMVALLVRWGGGDGGGGSGCACCVVSSLSRKSSAPINSLPCVFKSSGCMSWSVPSRIRCHIFRIFVTRITFVKIGIGGVWKPFSTCSWPPFLAQHMLVSLRYQCIFS